MKRTSFERSRTLSDITGADIWLKFENLQFTATFKERGALNRLSALSADERRRGVIACSAGNHAQGVAYHAANLSIPATIVMPVGTPTVKIENTRRHGATVIEGGATLEEAAALATEIGRQQQLTFVHPYDDPLIIAGQGTTALEMLAAVPDLDVLIVPIGGGGLISGMAVAAKSIKPGIEIVGVQATLYPSMYNLIKGEQLPMRGDTLAEGIAVKAPGKITSEIVRALVDDIVLVSEAQIEHAVSLLITIEKTVTEGAGAAGLAAVLANAERFKGRTLGLVLSGGNIDTRLLSGVLTRQLAREGRLSQLKFDIVDRPGQLGMVVAVLGQQRRQHRRGVASAHLHRSAGQGGGARGGDRDQGPIPSCCRHCRLEGGQHRCGCRRALGRADGDEARSRAIVAFPIAPKTLYGAARPCNQQVYIIH